MRNLLQWGLTPLILAAATPTYSRQASAPTARSLVDSALARLGGAEHISLQRTWFVAGVGEENLSAELQGLAPDRPTTRPHEEWLGVDAAVQSVAWERRTPRNDQSLRWRRFVYRHDSTGVIVWTDSSARMNSAVAPATHRLAMMRRVPHLLLLEVARAESLHLGRSATMFGRRHHEVRVRLDDAWISLWLSAHSSFLHRVEYRTVLPGRGEVAVQWEWPTWQRADSVMLRPAGHRVLIDGRVYQRVEYRRFEAASGAADSLLTVPNELRVRRMAMVAPQAAARRDTLPATGEVVPGIHVEELGGFNVLIAEFADFVLLVETPAVHPGFESIPASRGADGISSDVAARIRAIARGRPLGYTVLTHHHSDHVGNSPALAGLTRAFLVPADSKRLIESAINGRETPRVDPVVRTRTIRDSTRTVVIYDVGANPHTQHNLFVWFPRERIGFQGDLFYYDQGAASIPADRRPISVFFARWLRNNGISPRAIYGVHNTGYAGPAILSATAR